MTEEVEKCSCGYEDGTFACKIRHIQINSGAAKAANDSSKNFGFTERPK